MTSYYCQHLCNLYTILSQKLFALIWFFVAEISWFKGKNNFECISLSLSLIRTPLLTAPRLSRMCTGKWRTSSTLFFFFSTSTRRDVRISREKLGHSVFFFFRNGGRHSRFSSAFNVTFDLSYLASHLSYRLRTKCILKWKSLVVGGILKNDISRLIQFS